MELYLLKLTDKREETLVKPILKYTKLSESPSFLLVRQGKLTLEDNSETDLVEIFKVEFVAACKIDLFEFPLIVAFYLDECEMTGYVISGLPTGYANGNEQMTILDYESYLKICEYTGEKKKSIIELLHDRNRGLIGVNTYERVDDEYLNYDSVIRYYNSKSE